MKENTIDYDALIEKESSIPMYCTRCGSRLKVKVKIYKNEMYDQRTGELIVGRPVIYHYWSCPKAGFLNWNAHDVGDDEPHDQGIP